MTEPGIINIVLDMGNVLTIYHAREYIGQYVETEEDYYILQNQVCRSEEWICLDRGTMTDEEAVFSMCRRIPARLHATVARFVREYRFNQLPNPPMEELLRELKENGYRLYLLSNTSKRFHRFSKNIPSIRYMDGIYVSCDHGLLKPEKEIYLDFYREFGLRPEDCFFIDDMPANVESAHRTGMMGCVYHQNVPELRQRLREAGIRVMSKEDM
ncbi:MAG: HAD family hydrolase [Lachnospiraceae bacterium]